MKDKEKATDKVEKSEKDLKADQFIDRQPFVFEEDKELVEALSHQSRYMRGLFNT